MRPADLTQLDLDGPRERLVDELAQECRTMAAAQAELPVPVDPDEAADADQGRTAALRPVTLPARQPRA